MTDGDPNGSAGRQLPMEKRGGYGGTHDPGQPTGLMQPQTNPVGHTPAQPSAGQQPAGGGPSDGSGSGE
jgi:hypothetical protein